MRVNVCSCLLLCVLGCNISAEIIHEAAEEKKSVTLPCPHPVKGDVTWSRETNGHKVNILTAGGEGDKRHIHDPGKRFSSLADKSLHIRRVNTSDSGRYLCNDEPAVNLTVIPPGTMRRTAAVTTSISLTCPSNVTGSPVRTWIRQNSGTNVTVSSQDEKQKHGLSPDHIRFQISAEEPRTLTIRELQPDDAGLYYCDGNAAAYLNVTGGPQSERADVLLPAVLLPLLFIIIIISIILFLAIRRRGRGEQRAEVVYDEVPDVSVFEPAQDGSNQHDLTYSIICDHPAQGNKTTTFQPNVTLYSQINKPRHHRENV